MYYQNFKAFCVNEGKYTPANKKFRFPLSYIMELREELANVGSEIHDNWSFDDYHYNTHKIMMFQSKDLGIDLFVEPFYRGIGAPESERTNQINASIMVGEEIIDDEENTMDDIDSLLTGDIDQDVTILKGMMHKVLENAGDHKNIANFLHSKFDNPFEIAKNAYLGFPFVMILLQQGYDPLPTFGSWENVLEYLEEGKEEGYDFEYFPGLVNLPVIGPMIRRNVKTKNLFGI